MKVLPDQVFGRTLVGYDMRKPETLSAVRMTSYDEESRYETVYDIYAPHLSGVNLFFIDPSSSSSMIVPENGRIVAFDLPTMYVEKMAKGIVSVPPALPWFVDMNRWDFLGFDIVDARTQLSGLELYLDTTGGEVATNFTLLNGFGLIENIALARTYSNMLSEKIPGHAPMVPCGVWLKELPEGPLPAIETLNDRC